jgi:transcriptional regulator
MMNASGNFDDALSGTVRQKMFALLTEGRQDARSLSQQLGISEKEVVEHLPHLERTARNQGRRLTIIASECLSCGFRFQDRKRPKKPGRCPHCRSTHLTMPAYCIN